MRLTRSQYRALQSEYPVGNPIGGPAYGEKRDFIGDVVGDVFGSITGSKQQAEAAGQASATQAAASAAGIEEQQRQFDRMVDLMSPYVTAGTEALPGLKTFAQVGAPALAQQRALAGLDGPEAQQAAIRMIESSPEMAAYTQQGENAILQNASATGGLRGGNTQGALAQFRPELLAQLIDRQYSRLGGLTALGQGTTQNLTSLGQASASGQAAQGMQSGATIANLLGQQGAATAGGQLAQGSVVGSTFGTLTNLAGSFIGAGGFPGISKAFSF